MHIYLLTLQKETQEDKPENSKIGYLQGWGKRHRVKGGDSSLYWRFYFWKHVNVHFFKK